MEVLTLAPNDRPFVEVGTIEVDQDALGPGLPALVGKVRQRAARMGCHAVVIRDQYETHGGHDLSDAFIDRQGVRATCIAFRDREDARSVVASEVVLPGSTPPECRPYKRAIYQARDAERRLAAVKRTPPSCL